MRFRRGELLREAMTHASWNNERGRPSGPGHDNERLEYLGDAVLELVVGEYLFRRFPEYDEGQLTQLRAALVNTASLATLAERLNLGEALMLGRGAAKTGASRLPSLLANAFEAMIGAIFLDQGYRVATRVFLQNIGDLEDWRDANYKGRLQEVAQERLGATPSYRVSALPTPGHRRRYTADAVVAGDVLGTGTGATKQAAEQAAARAAVEHLGTRRRPPVSTAARAAGAAGRARRDAAGESVRARRRIAEAAADDAVKQPARRASATGRRRPADEPAAVPPAPAASPSRRRGGLLSALRSAAEVLVGRRATEEEEAVPVPAPEPPTEAGARRGRRGRRGGRGRGGRGAGAATAETDSPVRNGTRTPRPRGGGAPARRRGGGGGTPGASAP